MNTKKMIDEISALPVEERVMIVDSLLRSLNQPESEIDKKWIAIAHRRLMEMRSGTDGMAIPGNEVFDRVWQRFQK
ncbi:MAG: addiction module protein [Gammaproteobacteria bacterium]|nr:addiction module protein [Pseudomonadota bacterium]QOJ22906.1 MAG: addiction module protein [Gammaproteobacteria bacterium]